MSTPVVLLLVVLVLVSGCSAGSAAQEPPLPETSGVSELPAGLTAYVDQSRLQRDSRTVFVRLVNTGEQRLEVTRAEIGSSRFTAVTWTGRRSFEKEADLEFELPPSWCGTGSDARVRLTYRVDGGPMRVLGSGPDSVWELPVRLRPTGARDDVSFLGFEGTVLFAQASGSASLADATAYPLGPGDPPVEVLLRLVPARCDPHALAEDKVGTLIGVHLDAPGLPDPATFYLPIGAERRASLRGSFFPRHCGLA